MVVVGHGTSLLLLLLSRRIQLPSKLSWPDVRLFACHESWHANRRTSGQLSFEGSWILLLNNNSSKLVPITDCSDSK